jgi:dihydropteroate synthase
MVLKPAEGRALVMGIVNVTPDSFSDGGRHVTLRAAVSHAMSLAADGADVLDIGGESTRPGAEPVTAEAEIERVVPVIEAIRARWDGPISIDTRRPETARAAFAAGAGIWNDVTALGHAPESPAVAAELGATVILMHMKGVPQTMQAAPDYEDVVAEVAAYLKDRAQTALGAGVAFERIWLDPGIGFGKTTAHNLALTARLETLRALGHPVLYAASRKRMIQSLDKTAFDPRDRIGGSLALALESVRRGAAMVRVHDVRETVQALKLQAAVKAAGELA